MVFTGATLLPTRLGFAPGRWTIAFADLHLPMVEAEDAFFEAVEAFLDA